MVVEVVFSVLDCEIEEILKKIDFFLIYRFQNLFSFNDRTWCVFVLCICVSHDFIFVFIIIKFANLVFIVLISIICFVLAFDMVL